MVQRTSSPIPNMVGVSVSTDGLNEQQQSSPKKFPHRNSTSPRATSARSPTATLAPGVMAKLTRKFPAPLGFFSGSGNSRLSPEQKIGEGDLDTVNSQGTRMKRLGISRAPLPYVSDEYEESTVCTDGTMLSHRLGIVRPNYQDNPHLNLSPINLYKKASSPAPNLVRSDDSESDGDSVWPPKVSAVLHRDHFVSNLQTQHEEQPGLNINNNNNRNIQKDDGVNRFIHQQTAQGHYLVNSQPLDTPGDGIKYSLKDGKEATSPTARKALTTPSAIKTRPNLISASSASTAAPVAADEPFKVFLLLIQPESKIFEIIQVFYLPSQTTVRNLIDMIPINATEPALGSQEYDGLCRPTDGVPISLNWMASSKFLSKNCARIVRGEMLVAIPKGYSGPLCARISSPILSNPKVRKLLERSDPLAPKRKKKRSTHSRRTIEIQALREDNDSQGSSGTRDFEETMRSEMISKEKELARMQRHAVRNALKSAAIEAASTNAQVERDTIPTTDDDGSDIPVEMWRTTMSLKSQCTRSSSFGGSSVGSIDNTAECKSLSSDLPSSYGSLDAEFLESLKRMPRKKARPRRSTRQQNYRKLVRNIALAVLAMLARYLMVRNQSTNVLPQENAVRQEGFFGLWGLIQVVVTFSAFVKLQWYLQGKGDVQRCPFVKILIRTTSSHRSLLRNRDP